MSCQVKTVYQNYVLSLTLIISWRIVQACEWQRGQANKKDGAGHAAPSPCFSASAGKAGPAQARAVRIFLPRIAEPTRPKPASSMAQVAGSGTAGGGGGGGGGKLPLKP